MHVRLCLFAALFLFVTTAFAQDEVTLEPSKDNTLYQQSAGTLSNGAGDFLFAGTTVPGDIRRAVLAFDLAGALPEGAQVQSVALELHMSRTISSTQTHTLHPLTADWGEGTSHAAGEEGGGAESTTDDATWLHRFYDTEMWSTAGGDFDETPSATFDVGGTGSYTISSDEMADDVRRWLSDPTTNFGWIIVGNESVGTTAKRFGSRENPTTGNRPQLTITYTISNTAAEGHDLPKKLDLTGNFPNPFANETTIRYELERGQEVSLSVYDVLGRRVRVLVDGYQSAGRHDVTVSSEGLSAGVYLYCLAGTISCGRMNVLP